MDIDIGFIFHPFTQNIRLMWRCNTLPPQLPVYIALQIIGPFKSFTAVIGPNGSGKSNLMDAISFVLGVRSMQLRGQQLRDLVFAENDVDKSAKRKCSVMMVFRNRDKSETSFKRSVTSQVAFFFGQKEGIDRNHCY